MVFLLMTELFNVYRRCIYCHRGAFGDMNEHLKVCPKYAIRNLARDMMKVQMYSPRGTVFEMKKPNE